MRGPRKRPKNALRGEWVVNLSRSWSRPAAWEIATAIAVGRAAAATIKAAAANSPDAAWLTQIAAAERAIPATAIDTARYLCDRIPASN